MLLNEHGQAGLHQLDGPPGHGKEESSGVLHAMIEIFCRWFYTRLLPKQVALPSLSPPAMQEQQLLPSHHLVDAR